MLPEPSLTILDSIHALVFVLDRQGKIVYLNKTCQEIASLSFNDVEGKCFGDLLLSSNDAEAFKANLESSPLGLLSHQHKSSYITKNGNKKLITWFYRSFLDRSDSVEYILVTGVEIPQSVQVEEERYNYETFYHAFDAANDIIFVHDLKTLEFRYANDKACDMFGYTREELAQLNITDLSLGEPPYTQAEAASRIMKSVTTGEPEIFEWLSKKRTGELFWVEVNLKPVTIAQRGYLLVMSRDITERKRAEEALRKSEAQLRQKAEELEQTLQELKQAQLQLIQSEKMSSLGQLVAGVAHEINNPVNFIYGNIAHTNEYSQDLLDLVDLYQQHYPNPVPEIQEKIDNIDLEFLIEDLPKLICSMKVGAERIREIVLSLRNFSRLDEAEMKPVQLEEGIDSTLLILQNRLKGNNYRPTIEVIKNYDNLPMVECYAGQINQVFMNIIANAIDALNDYASNLSTDQIKSQPCRITIKTEVTRPGYVTTRIADNGPGMTEETKKRLFDPFFTTKAVGQGTGLGLSISYQIVVNKHGGTLDCISTPGKGTEFIMEIPILQLPLQ